MNSGALNPPPAIGLRAQPVALAQDDRAGRDIQVGAGDEHPREVADGRGSLGGGADHEARGVAEEQQRQLECVAQLHEAACLVGAVGVDRAAEMGWVAGHHAEGMSVVARERRDDAEAEAAS